MVDQTGEEAPRFPAQFPNTWNFWFKYNSYSAYLKSKKMKFTGTRKWKKEVKSGAVKTEKPNSL